VRPRPSDPRQGILRLGPHSFPCALGRGGVSARKREGDGRSPLGPLRVLRGFHRPRASFDMAPCRTRLAMTPASEALGWCDAPGDRNYNRPVRIPYPASHERMRRGDGLYDVCVVLDWNVSERRQGRGSAIFLHLARPGFAPTEGCVAVSRRVMMRILPHLARGVLVLVKGG
jgi:L,D-peptidoglycan transpeptidase YkuD (ErfK/YbiS/YcfS/YnhG family)